ncbi:hypothetical protein NPIL_566931 [Nephila pilipes]|uniref:Uncharacterized protein n=1 Tax=Nephila pilipes TaxID=299642 RepID=A0A8X6K330_NEPPI|nr:hypothetical protein NPIL_566931 [Nephila pilipes]
MCFVSVYLLCRLLYFSRNTTLPLATRTSTFIPPFTVSRLLSSLLQKPLPFKARAIPATCFGLVLQKNWQAAAACRFCTPYLPWQMAPGTGAVCLPAKTAVTVR